MPFDPGESHRIAHSLYQRWCLRYLKVDPNYPPGFRTFVAIDTPTEEAFERENRQPSPIPTWSSEDILDREG